MPKLADRCRVIAPDYPGYGQSDQPPMDRFTYSFDNLAAVIGKFTQWVPAKAYWNDKSEANAAKLRPLFEFEATRWQYTEGYRDPATHVSPDAAVIDQAYMDRPANKAIQLEMFYSYGSNPPLYPAWQAYFRKHQPPMLIVWGKNDKIFPAAGPSPYLRDLPKAELHLLNTGHFALEEDGAEIARLMRDFLARTLRR